MTTATATAPRRDLSDAALLARYVVELPKLEQAARGATARLRHVRRRLARARRGRDKETRRREVEIERHARGALSRACADLRWCAAACRSLSERRTTC